MDIQNWVNTVIRCNSNDYPSQYESRVADSLSSRPKRKKDSSRSQKYHEGIPSSPDRAHTSEVRKWHAEEFVNGRKLVKDSKIGQIIEIATNDKDINDNSSRKYRRKSRRKTRPERYDLKVEKKHRSKIVSKPDKDNQKPRKRNGCKEKTRSGWPPLSGSTYLRMTDLCPSRPRLSVS